MSELRTRLIAQNPWWRNPAEIDSDPVLMKLEQAPFRRPLPLLDDMKLDRSAVYTLRGPRRVGKTTALKLIVRDAIAHGRADRTLFYSFDLESDPSALVDVYQAARQINAGGGEGPWLVLFDEITSVPGWQSAVKYLRDQTAAAADALVLTGSSARDIRLASERLPGRRGRIERLDRLLLPLSFREFVAASGAPIDLGDPLTLAEVLGEDVPAALRRSELYLGELTERFERYLGTGGFPEAVSDHLLHGEVEELTVRMLWDVVSGEVSRWNRNRLTALKLLERVVRSLGSRFSWNSLAEDIGVASPATAQEYAELLSESYLLLILYHWDLGGGTISPKKQKKVYGIDPLLLRIPSIVQPGSPPPGAAALVENAVAMTLFRTLEKDPTESFGLPRSLFYWQSSAGREIDFLADPSGLKIPVEVAYRSQAKKGKTIESMKRRFGRGIIATRETLELEDTVRLVPSAVLCYLLDVGA